MSKKESIFDQMMKDDKFKKLFQEKQARIDKYYSCGFVSSFTVDRAVVIIKKKQPFLDWANNLPDPDSDSTLESINSEPSTYLIQNDGDDDLLDRLKCIAPEIFELEMNGWWIEEKDWESDKSWENFCKWFDFTISSLPIDLGEEDIFREEY